MLLPWLVLYRINGYLVKIPPPALDTSGAALARKSVKYIRMSERRYAALHTSRMVYAPDDRQRPPGDYLAHLPSPVDVPFLCSFVSTETVSF